LTNLLNFLILSLLFYQSMSTRIIVLAAGKGKRMGANVPKPLVEIAGRPMVRHLLDSIADSDIDERPILVVAPDNLSEFHEVCSEKDCDYAIQEEQLGTGHAVMSARDNASGADTVIVLYGDHPFISTDTIKKLDEVQCERQATITMLTTKVPNFENEYRMFSSWSRIIRNETGGLKRDVQIKDANEEELKIKEVNPCIYAFNAEWLWEHLPEIKNKNASGEYYLTDLIAMAIEEGEAVVTIPVKPLEVVGVNTHDELKTAEEILG